jgi:hypothetical protein
MGRRTGTDPTAESRCDRQGASGSTEHRLGEPGDTDEPGRNRGHHTHFPDGSQTEQEVCQHGATDACGCSRVSPPRNQAEGQRGPALDTPSARQTTEAGAEMSVSLELSKLPGIAPGVAGHCNGRPAGTVLGGMDAWSGLDQPLNVELLCCPGGSADPERSRMK